MYILANSVLNDLNTQFNTVVDRVFNWSAIGSFVIVMIAAFVIGRIIAFILRRLNKIISRQADKSENLPTVERLRRMETVIVISIALVRVLLFALAIYIWWVITHPGQQSSALIGASAFFAIVAGGALRPVLSDLAAGSMMMSEHWFGVGDHIKVEPFADMQGIVERVTLRSTRVRGLNGEIIWVNNQNIGAVRVTQKGSRSIAIELFVSDAEAGSELIRQTNLRLPQGPLMMITPLKLVTSDQAAPEIWHLRALGQTAPGREWLLEKYAIEVLQELDEKKKKPILKSEPISRYADAEAEKRYSRSIRNARKTVIKPTLTESITGQLYDVSKEALKLANDPIARRDKKHAKKHHKNKLIQ